MQKPIVIMGASRSGTSLTAGIFAAHGVWVGNCLPADHRNSKGFFENMAMKTMLEGNAHPAQWQEFLPILLANEGYDGGHLLFKHGPEHFDIWEGMDVYAVCCRRVWNEVRDSRARAGFPPLHPNLWAQGQMIMDGIVKNNGGINVNCGGLKHGDYLSIVNALEYVGIKPDMGKIQEFYDQTLWNNGKV